MQERLGEVPAAVHVVLPIEAAVPATHTHAITAATTRITSADRPVKRASSWGYHVSVSYMMDQALMHPCTEPCLLPLPSTHLSSPSFEKYFCACVRICSFVLVLSTSEIFFHACVLQHQQPFQSPVEAFDLF